MVSVCAITNDSVVQAAGPGATLIIDAGESLTIGACSAGNDSELLAEDTVRNLFQAITGRLMT